ncbi:hypothetical protein, partial [Peribacillus simplex]|uniref:hypothetical protein n=1 Tax=Peribacillus simplex TaxID=1478 RepID=UPI001A920D9C
KVDWNGRYETPAGKARLGETPQAKAEEAPRRVPGVEINVQIVQAIKIDKLDFHRVCLQSEAVTFQ